MTQPVKMADALDAAKVALEGAQATGAEGAWRLAALEVERDLVCRSCKAGDSQHATCDRAFRLARKFRGRADVAREKRGTSRTRPAAGEE